ncbi:MAG: acyl-CoA thioesterase [Clostridiales bacterium]|nr:acyl-CoA thioesterase [Clostridiales bacterium]
MSERPMKRVSDSYTTQVQILTQANLNGYNRLFGGQLMSWMDIVAAVVARRHSGRNVTTVRVEDLEFKAPAHANDTLMLTGYICHAGTTSMEICVNVYVEELSGERELINQAHFIMVALDETERPARVPGLILETDQQRKEWDAAERRRQMRKKE